MPIRAPARVGSLSDVDKTFLFGGEVTVVVDPEEVAQRVEGRFVHIAQAGRIDLEIGAIEFAADNGPTERVVKVLTVSGGDVHAAIGDGGVEASVGADDWTTEVVAAVADVDGKPVGEHVAMIEDTVASGVGEADEVGFNGGVDGIVPGRDAGGDAGDGGVFGGVEF